MSHVLFLFPMGKNIPTGGLKVVYDYCNRLANNGCDISIVYAAYFDSTEKTLKRRIKAVAKYVYAKVVYSKRGYTWYEKERNIREYFIWSPNYKYLPKADVYIATAVNTAAYIASLPVDDDSKFYFIQGYEDFVINDDSYIKWTYRLPLKKIVISRWLSKLVAEQGQESIVIPNGFDSNRFKLTVPVEEKDKYLVSMLYHVNERKDVKVGLRALELAKKHVPQLRLVLFGAYPKPLNLPEWVTYYQKPSMEEHLRINNQAAIYVGSSRIEGWGLTVGEAMMCGQAVACTNNEGYREMATDGVNALVSPICDPEALSGNILRLINDDVLRCRIAYKGLETIREFDFEESYKKFRNYILT